MAIQSLTQPAADDRPFPLGAHLSIVQEPTRLTPTGAIHHDMRATDEFLVWDGIAGDGVVEVLFALSNGYLGIPATLPYHNAAAMPGMYIAGVFDRPDHRDEAPYLVRGPDCELVRILVEDEVLTFHPEQVLKHRLRLDLRRGLVVRDWWHRSPNGRITQFRSLVCASLADRHTLLQRVHLTPINYSAPITAEALLDGRVNGHHDSHELMPVVADGTTLAFRTQSSAVTLACALGTTLRAPANAGSPTPLAGADWIGQRWQWQADRGQTYLLDKLVSVWTSRDAPEPLASTRRHLAAAVASGADAMLKAHERARTRRYAQAIQIAGDPAAQCALHFAVHHLVGAANEEDQRVSIAARGLVGSAYQGHVFWDTEIYMLPFFVTTDPGSARALLLYRYHTLPAARAKAAQFGYRGALYAWESTDSGAEATPTQVIGANGEIIPIMTGRQGHHVSAAVAYAVWQYWQATRDEAFFTDAGAEMVLETARFWASRATREADGHYHIRSVVGPDEYHDTVDDNAYTNEMARWNLRRGLEAAALLDARWPQRWRSLQEQLALEPSELAVWQGVADGLVDGLDPHSGVIEQFAGYHALADVDLATFEPRTVPMDVILGREQTRLAKISKQPDVLLLLYLLWGAFPRRVHEANLRYYEPQCGHGSSLSPGIHAALAARLGEMPLAERYFARTAAIDLGDSMGNAAGGVHLAAHGSLWQAAVFGFAGVELGDEYLAFQPHLPERWHEVRLTLHWRGRTLQLILAQEPSFCVVTLEAGPPVVVSVGGAPGGSLMARQSWRAEGISDRWELREG